MFRNLVAISVLALTGTSAFAVDEVALKASTPNLPNTVLTPANAVSYNGTIVGAPEWVRPFADGTCCSGLGPVRYTTQSFHLTAGDTCDINSVQAGWDGYLFVYLAPFNPLAQTVNFVAGDDDGNGGIGTSDIVGLPLSANTTYVAVTTAFELGEEGTFSNTINCPSATVVLGPYVSAPPVAAPSMNAGGLAALAGLLLALGLVAVRSRH